MDLSTTHAAYAAPLPDLSRFMQSWTEASTQAGDASTAFARELLAASMQWLEEGANGTEQWFAAVSGNAHRLAEAAHEAGAKAALAEDASTLWNAELELAGQAAQMTGTSLQDLWAALVEQQSQFAKSALSYNNERMLRLVQTMGLGGFALPALSVAPAAPLRSKAKAHSAAC